MGDGAVVLAIIDRVRKDTDDRFVVSIGLADGGATSSASPTPLRGC